MCEELEPTEQRVGPGGTIFSEGDLAGRAIDWRVAVAEIGEGNISASAEASAAIDLYQPDLILFVGVAGGLKADIPQGSVVVASKVYQYQSGKDAEQMLTRPIVFPTDHALEQLARQVRREQWDWEGEQPLVEVKPIAAGELVLANAQSDTVRLIRERFNDAAAVDMESAGMYLAAQRARGVPALAIRGISDMLDNKTTENDANWQARAARNAARFAVALLCWATPATLAVGSSGGDGASSELETLLAQLPITAADLLRQLDSPADIRWVRMLAESSPPAASFAATRAEIRGALGNRPRWTLALAEYALAHGLEQEAFELLVEHAESTQHQAASLVRAAQVALGQSDLDGARALIARAREAAASDSDLAYAEMVGFIIEEDYEAAVGAGARISTSHVEAQIIRSRAMAALGMIHEARDLVVELVKDQPRGSAGLMQEAAERIIHAVGAGAPEQGELEHLKLAYELAIAARDQRRAWNGSSAEAARLAATASGMLNDFWGVLSIVREPPHGQATPREAASPDLCRMGCYVALALSDFSLARDLLSRITDPIERELLEASLGEREGTSPSDLILMLQRIVAHHGTAPDQLQRALLGLARVGGDVTAGLARLENVAPDVAKHTRARIAILHGDTTTARRLLKGSNSGLSAEMLEHASLKDGRLDDFVDRLRERFSITGNPGYLSEAAEHLIRAERITEARDLALEGLAVAGAPSPIRLALEAVATQAYADLHDWPQVERHAKAILDLDSTHPRAGWALVFALHNQRRLDDAFSVLRKNRLTAENEDQAMCALMLWRQHGTPADAIDALVEIARAFPDSEQVVGAALMCSFDQSARLQSETRDEEVAAKLSDLSDRFFTAWPNSEIVTRLSDDDPEKLLEKMAELVRRNGEPPEQLAEFAAQAARGQLPLGLVAAVVGKPLTELVVSGAAGPTLVDVLDQSVREHENADAAAALGGDVVVDVHGLGSLAALSDHSDVLLTAFLRLRVTLAVLDDVLDGAGRLNWRSTATMSWDSEHQRMALHEISDGEAEARSTRAAEALRLGRDMVVERVEVEAMIDAPRLGVMLSPIELARRRSIPLWSDDPALRAAARAEHISAFSTLSLMKALVERGDLSPLRADQMKIALLSARFDFEASAALLLAYLQANDFDMSALGILARRTVWRDPAEGLHTTKACLVAVSSDSERWVEAVACAAYGAASAVSVDAQMTAITAVALSALLNSPDQQAAFQLVLDAARKAAAAIRLDDPLRDIIQRLVDAYHGVVPAELIPRIVLHTILRSNDQDRRVAVEMLLA